MTDSSGTSDRVPDVSESQETTAHCLGESVSTHAIFQLDSDGDIVTWSGPAESLYGHETKTIIGQHVRVLFADKDSNESDSLPENYSNR